MRRRQVYKLVRQTKTRSLNLVIVTLFIASVAGSVLPLLSSNRVEAANSTITPASLNGWVASSSDGGQTTFVADSSAPLGEGALKLVTSSSVNSVARLTHDFSLPLNDVTTLSYQTKQLSAADTTNGNITMRINIDTDNDGTFDDQLMFEPYYNGFNGNTQSGWQTWNVATGKLWSNYELHYNGLGGVGAGSYASNFTIADVLHDYPSAKLTGLVVSMGTWNISQQALADNLVLNDDVFNFEPVQITACSTTNSIVTTDLSTWNLSETRATGHNQIVPGGLHVWTEGNTSTDKAAAYYPASFNLADLGAGFGVTTSGGSGTLPSLQLLVDLDGNGTPEGYLVGEPVSYGVNTLWLSSNWTGIDLSDAPTAFNGGGTGKGGTANAWLSVFPNAKVYAIGYSLGSGALGDYTITKISAGCTDYTFDVAPPAVPTNLRYEAPARACGTATNINYSKPTWDAVPGAVSYDYQALFNGSVVFSTNYPTNQHPGGTFGGGQNGVWAFQVRSVSADGTKSAWSTSCPITLDTIAPDQPVHLSPGNNTAINYNSFWFDWTDVTGAVSYEAQFSQSNATDANGVLNVGVWSGDASHNQPTESRAWSSGANGTWYWQVRAVDAAGNKSSWTTPWKVTIDMVAPSAPTNLGWQTSDGTVVPDNGQTDQYSGTALWASVSDADHYIYKYWNDITGNPYKVGSEYVATTSGTNLGGVFNQGEGVHHFCVVAVDAAGNQSACSTPFTITYDTSPPTTDDNTDTTTDNQNNNSGSNTGGNAANAQGGGTGGTVAGVSTTNNGGTNTNTRSSRAAVATSTTGNQTPDADSQEAETNDGTNTDNQQQVLGESTSNDTSTPVMAKVAKPGKFLVLGWWWLPILLGVGGFWWLIAALRRRKDDEEEA